MRHFVFRPGRLYRLFVGVTLAVVGLQLTGCVLRWGEAPIFGLTPTVGLVVTYPLVTNFVVSPAGPSVAMP